MNARTTWVLLFLLLLAGLAGYLVTRQEERMEDTVRKRLVDDFLPAAVSGLRVDQLRRDAHFEIHRDEKVGWRLVDPIDAPADSGVVERLLNDVYNAQAVASPVSDLEKLGLRPSPSAVLELYEGPPEAPIRMRRLELGEVSLDQQSVFVAFEGRAWRTLATLHTDLDRPLHEWRSHRIVDPPVSPTEVIEVHRRGHLTLDPKEEPRPLSFDAILSPDGWRATAPFAARLDPALFDGVFARAPAHLRIESFAGDDPDAPARFGLEPPDFQVTWGTQTDRTLTLAISRRDERWVARRTDLTAVWTLDEAAALTLAMPTEALVDHRLVRVLREDLDQVDLVRGDETLRILPDGKAWFLDTRERGSRVLADDERVADLLAVFEGAEAAGVLLDEPFQPRVPRRALRLVTRSGLRLEIELGAPLEREDGTRGVLARRDRETLVLLVPSQLVGAIETPRTELVSHRLHEVREDETASITVRAGARQREYVRDAASGRWLVRGSADPDPDFELLVDAVRVMRAERILPPGEGAGTAPDQAPEGGVHVSIARASGERIEFDLVPDGAGPGEDLYWTPERAAAVEPGLARSLMALFE